MKTKVNNIIPNSTKKRGRPVSFDADAALDAAVEVFWQKGFEGASMHDLTHAMGINKPSLYSAFGDKKSLFMHSLDRYSHSLGSKPMQAFLAEPDINEAVMKFLTVSLELQARPGDCAKGCLIASCGVASAELNLEVRGKIHEILEKSQMFLEQRFLSEIENRKLPPEFPHTERAILLLDMMQAQAYRARAGIRRAVLSSQIPFRVEAVLGKVSEIDNP